MPHFYIVQKVTHEKTPKRTVLWVNLETMPMKGDVLEVAEQVLTVDHRRMKEKMPSVPALEVHTEFNNRHYRDTPEQLAAYCERLVKQGWNVEDWK